jgi:thiamine kinase-like enzyme
VIAGKDSLLVNPVVSNIDQITLDWLDGVLFKSTALISGGIERFECQHQGNINSHNANIRLTYKADSTGKLPTKLFLKMCSNEGAFGRSEVDYFTRDYIDVPDAPIPTCYDAQYWPKPRMYHILTDDLSETHYHNKFTTPTFEYGCAVADGLATLHTRWWGETRLREAGATCGAIEIGRYMDFIQQGLLPMLEAVKDDISEAWKRAIRDIFEHHPNVMVKRAGNPNGLTIVHGDVNPTNVLSPHDPQGKTYIIDRQPFDWSLTAWTAASDLAYMIVTWWDVDLRRQFEFPILRHYHNNLLRRGIKDYSWEQLVSDYKLSVMQSLYVATQWCTEETACREMRFLWFTQLQRSMTAFDDLECEMLWRDA